MWVAASECSVCGWPEANARLIQNDEGVVVGVELTCLICGAMEYISHERDIV